MLSAGRPHRSSAVTTSVVVVIHNPIGMILLKQFDGAYCSTSGVRHYAHDVLLLLFPDDFAKWCNSQSHARFGRVEQRERRTSLKCLRGNTTGCQARCDRLSL